MASFFFDFGKKRGSYSASDSVSPDVQVSNGSSASLGSGVSGFDVAQLVNGAVQAGVSYYNAKKQRELTKQANEEAQRQFNENYAQSEYWNQVSQSNFENEAQIRTRDLMNAGLNPLSYAGGSASAISPAQSTTASMSDKAPQIDASAFTQILSQLIEHRWQSDENQKNRDLEFQRLEMESEKNWNDYIVAREKNRNDSEANAIRAREVDEYVRNNIKNNEIQQALASEQARANLMNEYFKKQGLDNEKIRLANDKLKQDREYQKILEQINNERIALNQAQQKIDNAKSEAEKNLAEKQKQRHWSFVSNLIGDMLSAGARVFDTLFGD